MKIIKCLFLEIKKTYEIVLTKKSDWIIDKKYNFSE